MSFVKLGYEMKHIGIVGISAMGSALCYKYIAEQAGKTGFPSTHPEITIHNFSFHEYYNAGPDDNNGWNKVHDIILSSIAKLKAAGADFIIIPANTVHHDFSYLEKNSILPIISILDVTVDECRKRKLNNVAILGTTLTTQRKLYSKKLEEKNIKPIIPNNEECKIIHEIIYKELMHGIVEISSAMKIKNIVTGLNCEGVILACTELPLLVSEKYMGITVLNSTEILAQRAYEHACQQ